MTQRLNVFAAAPAMMQSLIDYATNLGAAGLEHSLQELVKTRASQINGCAVCLHMHAADARKHGETEERIFMLDAWRESSLYTDRERAALGWTEALVLLSQSRAPDEAYDAVKAQFSDQELVQLTLLIGVINSFNQIGVGFRRSHPVPAGRAAA